LYEEGVRKSGYDGTPSGTAQFSPTEKYALRRETDPEKRYSFDSSLPQPIFVEIMRCSVANCGYFRVNGGYKIANQRLKWPPLKIDVLFSIEKLSKRAPERVIGGENELR